MSEKENVCRDVFFHRIGETTINDCMKKIHQEYERFNYWEEDPTRIKDAMMKNVDTIDVGFPHTIRRTPVVITSIDLVEKTIKYDFLKAPK